MMDTFAEGVYIPVHLMFYSINTDRNSNGRGVLTPKYELLVLRLLFASLFQYSCFLLNTTANPFNSTGFIELTPNS